MSKPRILVIYFSQTGQLRSILDSTLSQVAPQLDLSYAAIEAQTPWPFPWKASSFFDAMPESVVQQPAPVKPLPEAIKKGDYDLIILGWQPWFLHPSQPITAFLQSPDAAILSGKPVITVVGSRNMWLNAGEKIKEHLVGLEARLVGSIVFTDSNTNLISLLTIIRWSFSGKREATRWLPQAGVQDSDIRKADRFGAPILEYAQALSEARYNSQGADSHLQEAYPDERASDEFRAEMVTLESEESNNIPQHIPSLHSKLMSLGAIQLNTGLVLLEQRGIKNFRFWAKYIREKGGPGAMERQGRVTNFKRLLITAIFVLSPISSFTAFIQRNLQKKRLLKDVEYFKSLNYEKGRI